MAFATKRTTNFVPRLKWNGTTAQLYPEDLVSGEVVQGANLADHFFAVFDLENMKYGWSLLEKGEAPQFRWFPVTQEDIGPPPTDNPKWRLGILVNVKLEGEDFWRELFSQANGLWNALDAAHTDWAANAAQYPEMCPVLERVENLQHFSNKTGVYYEPVFEIAFWIDHNAILEREPQETKSNSPPAAKTVPQKRSDMDDEIPF